MASQCFLAMLSAAIVYYQPDRLSSPEYRPIDTKPDNLLLEYDFVIVGTGSSGKINICKYLIFLIYSQLNTRFCGCQSAIRKG